MAVRIAKIQNNGQVYISNGSHIRTVCSGAISGVVSGDEVHVTMSNGQVRIYNLSTGSHIRTI
jgi:hypothetical protein